MYVVKRKGPKFGERICVMVREYGVENVMANSFC